MANNKTNANDFDAMFNIQVFMFTYRVIKKVSK